jgi:hypothetical protein
MPQVKLSELKHIIRREITLVLEADSATTGDSDLFDDLPAVDLHIDDKGFMSINIQAMFHSPDNGKVNILQTNPNIKQQVVAMIQQEAQKLFRNAIHSLAGEPYGLKEKQDNMKLSELKQIIREEIQTVLVEAKKAKKKSKLDPVGKEDADIDNDGDVDSSDKYLKKRRSVIGKSIAKQKKAGK